jgi:hypothetical protein
MPYVLPGHRASTDVLFFTVDSFEADLSMKQNVQICQYGHILLSCEPHGHLHIPEEGQLALVTPKMVTAHVSVAAVGTKRQD